MKGVAPQDSPSCQEQPLGRTKPLHSFQGIGGAGGRKATRGEGQRGEKIAIKSNKTQNDLGQHPCVRGLAPPKQSFQFFRYLPKVQTGRPFPSRDHQVRRPRQRIFVQAKKLPDPAFDTVPLDRRTDIFPHRDPQSGMGQTVGAKGSSKMGGLDFNSCPGNTLEVGPLSNPLFFSEGKPGHFPRLRFPRRIGSQDSFASTISLFLPFALLRLRTSCPPLVDMRFLNPWVLLRRILLGW